MYQIDVSSAVGSLPTPAAAGTAGFFTDGNPASGLPATIVPADFLNTVMQELVNVVNEGGIPLSKTSYTQVRDAITNMIAAAGAGSTGTVTTVTGVAPINSSGGAAPQISISAATDSEPGSMSAADKAKLDAIAAGATANTGTVTAVTVESANGVSATVANQGTTPALTISLGAITPNSISTSGASSAGSYQTSGAATVGGVLTGGQVVSNSGVIAVQNFSSSTSNVILGPNGSGGSIALQPNGVSNPSGGVTINSAGQLTAYVWSATGSDRRLKRDIRKFEPRPLHRSVSFVTYTWKENGLPGIGAVAQQVQKAAPEHVGEFDWHKKKRLSLNYAGAAFEQAMWAGREIDRQAKLIAAQAKLIAKLEARVAKLEQRS